MLLVRHPADFLCPTPSALRKSLKVGRSTRLRPHGCGFAPAASFDKPSSCSDRCIGIRPVGPVMAGSQRVLSDKWIVTPRPNRAAAVRLVCLPHAGGGVATFRGWPEQLPAAEVSIVQLPGRGSRLREPLVDSLVSAADAVADSIAASPACPTVLLGHSLGALIAFESARRLRDRGWPLLALFVS